MSHQPMYNDGAGNTFLPGYGRPLKDCTSYYKDSELFPNALDSKNLNGGPATGMPVTLRELRMQHIMDELTDKPGWETKVFNKDITTKWREEISSSGEDVSSTMIDFIFDELKHKAKVFTKTGIITVFDQGVVKSDTIVPTELKVTLMEAVKSLEDVPDNQKDWHPGSDEKVLDLVHPSLFPLVYGLSRILPQGRMNIEEGLQRCGEGVVVPVPIGETTIYAQTYSEKFQWLPCEVNIRSEKARITSYINNLHPNHHKGLYSLIEQLIDHSIPLWDNVLTLSHDSSSVSKRIRYEEAEYDRDFDDLAEDEGPQRLDGEDEYEYEDRRRDWFKTVRICKQPEPEVFEPLEPLNLVCLREEYREYGLQVIVKLANIQLTPEKPEYAGGSWHVEGQLNEHIVSTALYYYSNENITMSKLAFRQQCEEHIDVSYEQNDHQWFNDVYGLENYGPAVQVLGGVKTSEGRLLAFPNVLQHQVQPFKLTDPTKPGHRKIVALFLVDPNFKVISTANIPCQRKDWWQEQLEAGKALEKLPAELRNQVVQDVEFPYGLEKAKELRLELMEERKSFVVEHNQSVFEAAEFSLCEH
ncbi:hypothetical protein BDQ17DRAFT_1367889 [Cyathus striatus]|nr:hypothetical protein BDQ17DRAFT_1367889 [Cyathus striatus]